MKFFHSLKATFLIAALSLIGACSDSGEIQSPASVSAPQTEITSRQNPLITDQSSLDKSFAQIDKYLQDEVDAKIRAGFVTLVAKDGEIIHQSALGMADRESALPMSIDTRFRIASMTKPITSLAILMLMEEGKLGLDDPAADYIPALAKMRVATSLSFDKNGQIPTTKLQSPITIRQLLTHTAGLGYLFDFQTDLGKFYLDNHLYFIEGDLEARINHLATLPLYTNPGTRWQYSYATDVLGRIVEVLSGQNLEAFMQTRIFDPLGMKDTFFLFDETDLENIATVYAHNELGEIIPFDGGDLIKNPNKNGAGWYSGGGGLVSTAGDYFKFMQMLINRGALAGKRIISKDSIDLIMSNHVTANASPKDWASQQRGFGLAGWVSIPAGQFGWGGYYDTSFTVDLDNNLAWMVMAQREPGPFDRPSNAAATLGEGVHNAITKNINR